MGFARQLGVRLGEGCEFFGTDAGTWGSDPYLITLGNKVRVTAGVRFITHDGSVFVFRDLYPDLDLVAPITVGNNVFIGTGATLLPGITVGDDSVIGAGSVVAKDVPPRSIAAGVPARVICTVDEWFERHRADFFHVRGRPLAERKRAFLERFGLDNTRP